MNAENIRPVDPRGAFGTTGSGSGSRPPVREIGIDQSYAEHSRVQIKAIKARYREGVDFALRELGENGVQWWLDIGCNRGFGLDQLSQLSARVVAVDIEEKYLREAIENNYGTDGAVMDGCRLGFPDDSFEVVSAFEVIEHLGEEDQGRLLSDIHRVLKPGGILVLSTPNRIASGKRRLSPDHQRELEPAELKRLLEESGFEIIEFLNQGFFNESFLHRMFRRARENPIVTYLYYFVLPWSIRSRIRDVMLTSQDGTEVRRPKADEIGRIMFVVCKKRK